MQQSANCLQALQITTEKPGNGRSGKPAALQVRIHPAAFAVLCGARIKAGEFTLDQSHQCSCFVMPFTLRSGHLRSQLPGDPALLKLKPEPVPVAPA